MYHDSTLSERNQANVSPVNFFVPNTLKYPHIKSATRSKVDLDVGDCMFVPAYYYYQMIGFTSIESKNFKTKHSMYNSATPKMHDKFTAETVNDETYRTEILMTAVSLKFKGNS